MRRVESRTTRYDHRSHSLGVNLYLAGTIGVSRVMAVGDPRTLAGISINQSLSRLGGSGRTGKHRLFWLKKRRHLSILPSILYRRTLKRFSTRQSLPSRWTRREVESKPPDLVLGGGEFSPRLSDIQQSRTRSSTLPPERPTEGSPPRRHPTDTSNFMQPPSTSKRPFTVSVAPPAPPPPACSRPTSTTMGLARNLTICFS